MIPLFVWFFLFVVFGYFLSTAYFFIVLQTSKQANVIYIKEKIIRWALKMKCGWLHSRFFFGHSVLFCSGAIIDKEIMVRFVA